LIAIRSNNVSLIVSGHTLLVVEAELRHHSWFDVDDAAGECFDKVAKLISLPYPGGPELNNSNRGMQAFAFPRPI
jgi:N6-L-threonylcarbamoyladenine synthase